MSRYPQKIGKRGSLKWIQKLVNEKLSLLDCKIRNGFDLTAAEKIEWLSPLPPILTAVRKSRQ
ncbi:MAG: hypothetical protein JSV60_05905 [Desulfobacterales bacterium]|nr:MAG: hypothetical protein JSV60_05905 [Desulfobacterales bacterium]